MHQTLFSHYDNKFSTIYAPLPGAQSEVVTLILRLKSFMTWASFLFWQTFHINATTDHLLHCESKLWCHCIATKARTWENVASIWKVYEWVWLHWVSLKLMLIFLKIRCHSTQCKKWGYKEMMMMITGKSKFFYKKLLNYSSFKKITNLWFCYLKI